MNTNSRPATRTTWFVLFAAMTWSVLVYGLLVYLLGQSRNRPPLAGTTHSVMRPVLYLLAGVNLLLAVVLPGFIVKKNTQTDSSAPIGSEPVPEPSVFQTASIVSLALSESCAIFGLLLYFMGEPAREFWSFAVLTLLFNVIYILPRGVRYWSLLQDRK